MSAAAEARLTALDAVADAQPASADLAADLLAVADAVAGQPALRRALTDPSTPDEARQALAQALLAPRVGAAAVAVVGEAARVRWSGAGAFVDALERQGVRALLRVAEAEGALDRLEDELFKVERLVDATPALRSALADRQAPLDARQRLIGGLVAGKVLVSTEQLAVRAVAARKRTFDLTVESYLAAAAELRSRAVATVTVARPLTPEQEHRLLAALTSQVGRALTLRVVVDPHVLGGVRVAVGDEVIEGTVSGRLHDARRKLA